MECYSVMKRDIFWLLICYTIIKCKSVFATNLNSNAGVDINWFKLGSEYIHSPALGWSLLTFSLFLCVVIYFSRLTLINLLHLRYNQTKSRIDSIRHEKISINKQLINQSHQIKNLNKNLKKIVLQTYYKIKVYQEKNTSYINILKRQLSENLIKYMYLSIIISTTKCHAMPHARAPHVRAARWRRRGQAMAKWRWGPSQGRRSGHPREPKATGR